MTSAPVVDTQPVPIVTDDPQPVHTPRRLTRAHVRRAIRLAVGVIIVLLLAYWVFEGPVASLWYQTRQDHLASDYNVARSHIKPGQAAAVIQIPTIGLNVTVGEGDNPGQLRSGPGHRPGTPLPGSVGNSVIFGHARAWGGPFGALSKVHINDSIYVESQSKETSVFVVTSVKRASGSDVRPFRASTDKRLTLITGTGGRLGSGRLVVVAVSGRIGHLKAGAVTPSAAVPKGNLILNQTVGSLLLCSLAALAVVVVLRRNHRTPTVAILATPVVLAALLSLMVEVDLFLSPLA